VANRAIPAKWEIARYHWCDRNDGFSFCSGMRNLIWYASSWQDTTEPYVSLLYITGI
jgi:hypothetical protein